ncbi:hypothetical protein V8E54_005231 [Elaphomyces granulatus]
MAICTPDSYAADLDLKPFKLSVPDSKNDENALLPLLEKTESFKERVVTSTAKVVRSELDVLNTKVKVFGQFDPTMTLRNYIFKTSFEGLKNTFQLLNHAAESRSRQREEHDPP